MSGNEIRILALNIRPKTRPAQRPPLRGKGPTPLGLGCQKWDTGNASFLLARPGFRICVFLEMKTSVFTSGGSQAVRIPKALRINAKRVEIERRGETLVLRPLPDENCWPDGYLESFAVGRLDDSFERAPQGEHREVKF